MNLIELQYAEYVLKFNSFFQTSKNTFAEKKIILLKLKTDTGKEVFGEVSLFPELGTETFEEAITQTKEAKNNIENHTLKSVEDLENYTNKFIRSPALRFGIEQALFYLNRSNCNKKSIEINAVVGNDIVEKLIRRINEYYHNGFTTFKLKVGEKEFSEDLQLLNQLKEEFNQLIKIRLDVNGKWGYEEARKNLNKLSNYDIEFVEQPTPNIIELEKLVHESKVKIAVDESANNFESAKEIIINSHIEIIVLKPVLIGSIKRTFELIDLAKSYDKSIIISSTFESSVGLNMLIHLSYHAGNRFAHGLGTFSYLGNNFEDSNVTFNAPQLVLNDNSEIGFILPNLNWQ